jgi:hypothetical protein
MTHDEVEAAAKWLEDRRPACAISYAAAALLRRLRDERDEARAQIEELEKAEARVKELEAEIAVRPPQEGEKP